MTVDDAIASIPKGPFSETPLMYLGDIAAIIEATCKGFSELLEDLRIATDGVPLPFERFQILETSGSGWALICVSRVGVADAEAVGQSGVQGEFYSRQPSGEWIKWASVAFMATAGETKFRFKIAEQSHFLKYDTSPEGRKVFGSEDPDGVSIFAKLLTYQCLLISHPANYIVKESPQLTPKEARRIENGKRFPDAKRPRYIIVDHDVLVGLRTPEGSHASPIPHQRRGHWMRLSERCRHAKERGLDRVWVRDTYVGETDFVANGRRYQVLLDFQVGQRT